MTVLISTTDIIAEQCDGYVESGETESNIQWLAYVVVVAAIVIIATCALKDSSRHSMDDV